MSCYRAIRAPQCARVIATPARNMSVFATPFPRFPNHEFAPFFNLIDDHFTQVASRSRVRAFQPRFDVKEGQDGYELRGELPGVDQKDIDIEFTDEKTLIIKGRTEREAQSVSAPPTEAEPTVTAQATETSDTASTSSFQHATVEDEEMAASTTGQLTPAETPAENTSAKHEPEAPTSRYWVSERSIGEFQRSFTFPARIDQDAVKASLKNGILNIVVPKAAIPAAKKINVE